MKRPDPICNEVREALATDGPRGLRDNDAARRHLAQCGDCFAFLESVDEIETGAGPRTRPSPGLPARVHPNSHK